MIFEIVVEDISLYSLELPTCMALSYWDQRPVSNRKKLPSERRVLEEPEMEWVLVDPTEAMHARQRRRNRAAKVRISQSLRNRCG